MEHGKYVVIAGKPIDVCEGIRLRKENYSTISVALPQVSRPMCGRSQLIIFIRVGVCVSLFFGCKEQNAATTQDVSSKQSCYQDLIQMCLALKLLSLPRWSCSKILLVENTILLPRIQLVKLLDLITNEASLKFC